MKLTIEEFMERLTASERKTQPERISHEEARLDELERENARLRNFVADLLMGRSA